MPVTCVRDIVVHGDDLAVATHGRGFWVMDQMTGAAADRGEGAEIVSSNAYLFQPGETLGDSSREHEWNSAAARGAAGVESSGGRGRLLLAEECAERASED